MATYHFQLKAIQRSMGQCSVASAAYRAGETLFCSHEGLKKRPHRNSDDVVCKKLLNWIGTRSELWSCAEIAETRINGIPAREVLVALPAELAATERERLALELGALLVSTYGVAADVAVHRPRTGDGANSNHHAHILFSSRKVEGGIFGKKIRELVSHKDGPGQIKWLRVQWERMVNHALEHGGHTARVSCARTKDPQPKLRVADAAVLRAGSPHEPVSTTLRRITKKKETKSPIAEFARPIPEKASNLRAIPAPAPAKKKRPAQRL